MPTHSAGLLLYRGAPGALEVFLIHMGGPFWAGKDVEAWSIPKGVVNPGEDPLAAAKREFHEETGFAVSGTPEPLGTFRQNSAKNLSVWSLEGDCDPAKLISSTFLLMWPPKSGRMKAFPEADRGAWLDQPTAFSKIVRGQQQVLSAFFNLRANIA